MTTQTTEPRPMKPYLINAVLDYRSEERSVGKECS